MLCLALETSCDETSAAVVKDGSEVLSNIISSQIKFHQKYGGIVPEVAARKHIEVITPVIQEAMDKAKVSFKELDAVAVTYGPGLVGSLLVGLCAAKAIAWAINKPLIGVNHLEGHIYANFLVPRPTFHVSQFPFICLLVSGGHTMIIKVKGHGEYETLGRTRDDAAGEAYDKVARLLKLGYPGGPVIDKLAKSGNPKAINFTRPMLNDGYDFSFSGIKTAVVNYVKQLSVVSRSPDVSRDELLVNIAASFQQAVVDVLIEKTVRAAKEHGCQTVTIAGGVSANSQLRTQLLSRCQEEGLTALIPSFEYCTDNAAMIGCAGYYKLTTNNTSQRTLGLQLTTSYSLSPIASLKI
jgi:N6-L-threonylcarbamoyladenine synthase